MSGIVPKIKKLAKLNGLTVKELAARAGVGETSIYRWDKNEPSIRSLKKVAAVLEVDYKVLLP